MIQISRKERYNFTLKRLQIELKNEDDCILFLIKVFEALGVKIIDYRNNASGRFHGTHEKGKDLIIKYNSFLNTYIGIQVKFVKGFKESVGLKAMRDHLNQIQGTFSEEYLIDNEVIYVQKAYLIVFGEVKQEGRQSFQSFQNRYHGKVELWTINSLLEFICEGKNWIKILRALKWESDFTEWGTLIKKEIKGELSYQISEYSPEIKLTIFNILCDFKIFSLPKSGLFLESYSENQALYYYGYGKKLWELSHNKVQKFYDEFSPDTNEFIPVYKVVGKSGIGKTSFLRAGLFKELVLLRKEEEFFPITIKVSFSLKSEGDLIDEIISHLDSLGLKALEKEIFKVGKLRTILVLDQFENILENEINANYFWKLVTNLCFKYKWQIVLGVRDDYLSDTNSFLQKQDTNKNVFIDYADIILDGITKTDVEEFLSSSRLEIVTKNINKILIYLIQEDKSENLIDPARLQILVYFLIQIGRNQENPILPNEQFLENFESNYLGFIFSKYTDWKPLILDILIRFSIKRGEYGRIIKKRFSLDEILRSIKLRSQIEIQNTLNILIENRILYREVTKNKTSYVLTHDRIANSVALNYKSIFSEHQILKEIESSYHDVISTNNSLPDKSKIKIWFNKFQIIQGSELERSYLDPSHKTYITLLSFIYSESSNFFENYSIKMSKKNWEEFSNVFRMFERHDHLQLGISFFGEQINSLIADQIICRFIDLTKDIDHKSYVFHSSNFLLAFNNYDGLWSKQLTSLVYDLFEHLDESMKIQIGNSLKKSIISNLLTNVSIDKINDTPKNLIFIKLLSYIDPEVAIFNKLSKLMENSALFWRICNIISIYSYQLELSKPKDFNLLQVRFIPKLIEKFNRNPEWLKLDEVPNDENTKSMYFTLKALTFLNYKNQQEILSVALEHKDYRIRRIAGAAFIKSAESEDLEKLILMITNTSLPKNIKRGGEGGDKYRLRQTIYEMLQMVVHKRLRLPISVIQKYNEILKSELQKKLDEIEVIYTKTKDGANNEYRDPDIYDEDLITLLLLLLSSVGLWDNIDIFLRVLEEPFSLIGAYDITEAGVVSIMKLASINQETKLSKPMEEKTKKRIVKCFSHIHNGVSGRAAKVLKWIGNEDDLNVLQDLESNTVKNLRENSLLAREAILARSGDDWGNDFASDSIAPIWL